MKSVDFGRYLAGALAFIFMGAVSAPVAAEMAKVWEATGFKGPESAVHDAAREVLYISNVNGEGTAKDENGFISKIGLDGTVLEEQWITGLDAPKGMALHGDRLYVSDIDRLVEIDITAGAVLNRYPAPGAKFLNDVAADEAGRVYVSDMLDNAIYRLADGDFGLWLQDTALDSPNGLFVKGDQLLVAAWGILSEGFATKSLGHLKSVSLTSKDVASLGDGTPVGNLDGLEADGKGKYLVTDWMAGGLFLIDSSGKSDLLMDLGQGSADIEFIEGQQLVIIPMMMDGKVTAYQVE